MSDDEIPTYADRVAIAEAAGLSPTVWADRLNGASIEELHADAARLAADVAGVLPAALDEIDDEAPPGSLGGGQRGGGHVRAPSMDEQIRSAFYRQRGASDK